MDTSELGPPTASARFRPASAGRFFFTEARDFSREAGAVKTTERDTERDGRARLPGTLTTQGSNSKPVLHPLSSSSRTR